MASARRVRLPGGREVVPVVTARAEQHLVVRGTLGGGGGRDRDRSRLGGRTGATLDHAGTPGEALELVERARLERRRSRASGPARPRASRRRRHPARPAANVAPPEGVVRSQPAGSASWKARLADQPRVLRHLGVAARALGGRVRPRRERPPARRRWRQRARDSSPPCSGPGGRRRRRRPLPAGSANATRARRRAGLRDHRDALGLVRLLAVADRRPGERLARAPRPAGALSCRHRRQGDGSRRRRTGSPAGGSGKPPFVVARST